MIKKILKFTFFITASLILVLTLSPLILFDKKDVVKIINQKVNEEFNLNLKFNEDIKINVFPFPKIKILDVNFIDKSLGIEVKSESVKLSSNWRTLLKLKPEIETIQINKPEIFLTKKKSISKLTLVKNETRKTKIEIFQNLLEKFKNIKIINGKVFFFISGDKNELDNLNFSVSSEDEIKAELEFNHVKYNSLIKIDASSRELKKIEYNINQLFSNSNEIFGSGILNVKNDQFFVNGNFNSQKIDVKQIFELVSQLNFYDKKQTQLVSTKIPSLNFDFNVELANVSYNKLKFKDVSSNILKKSNAIFIKDLRLKYLKSMMKLDGIYSYSNKNFKGDLAIYDFFYESPKMESDKIYLTDAYFDCDVKFSFINSANLQNILINTKAKGECINQKSRLIGVDISDLVKRADNIETFQDFFSLFNKNKIKGSSDIDSISLNFRLNKGIFTLDNLQAEQKNMRIKSKGNYSLYNEKFKIDNSVYIRTKKFKNLPEFNIIMNGNPEDYNISYDFEKVKDAIISDGINSILKKKKKLTLDPSSLQKIIKKNSKEIVPEDILDLFLD